VGSSREPEAEDEVRLVEAQERRDPVARRRNHHVEVLGSIANETLERVSVASCVLPGAEEGDGLVPKRAEELGETVDGRQDLRDDDDLHPRSK